jgi:NADPH2:quinone reductase
MRLESIREPEPLPHEVVVEIRAAGVNPVDTYIRSGKYVRLPSYPYVPGNDGAGVIVSVGREVDEYSVGDRVYLTGTGLGLGAYAEYAAYAATSVARIPPNLTYEQAAAVNVPYATAYRAIHSSGKVRGGDKVLIHGASGGVGLAAVQMAVAAGARVFATAGTDRGMELVREQGAHHCFNHRSPNYMQEIRDIAPDGIDLVIENLANVNLDADLMVLKTFGRIVVVGSRGRTEIDPRTILQKDATVCGMALWNASAKELSDIHSALFAGLSNDALRPVVGRRYSLADAALAHDAVLEPGAFGKIVLQP